MEYVVGSGHSESIVADMMINGERERRNGKMNLCEILGLEQGEEFNVVGFNCTFHIEDDGLIHTEYGGHVSDNVVREVIENPDFVVRREN